MIKRLIVFFILIGLNASCKYFEDCDGPVYQIKVKKEIGDGLCTYRAQSIADCLGWNDPVYLDFIDSCDTYSLSYILKREKLYEKYGK